MTGRAASLALWAGVLTAVSALFAASSAWSRQVYLDGKAAVVFLVLGLAAVGASRLASTLWTRLVAVAAAAMGIYLIATFGHAPRIGGGSSAAVLLLGLAVTLAGCTLVHNPDETVTAPPGQV